MPVFATPWLFGAAVAAAAAVTALHLLSVRTPPPLAFPTARFVTAGEARAVARQPRLNDIGLLLLRVLALLLLGAAFAGVRWEDRRASVLQLVVADARWATDTVWRDSLARVMSRDDTMLDVHFARGVADDPGVALIAATQRAVWLSAQYPALSRIELTIALPPTVATRAGYDAWRTQWPGTVHLLERATRAAIDSTPLAPGMIAVERGDRDDVVAAAMRNVTAPAGSLVRVHRGTGNAAPVDTGGSRGRGGALSPVVSIDVQWPRDGVPRDWVATTTPDTVAALAADGRTLVGPFERMAVPGAALQARLDSGYTAGRPVRAIAWWGDGVVAATEEAAEEGAAPTAPSCTRTVAVRLPAGSDLLLTDDARGLLRALSAPCGAASVATRTLERGRATGDSAAASVAAPAAAFRGLTAPRTGSDPWWLTPALMVAAILLLAMEWFWRERGAVA
ncbi:BatA domain-containing protein [Gemmatimonas sp.]